MYNNQGKHNHLCQINVVCHGEGNIYIQVGTPFYDRCHLQMAVLAIKSIALMQENTVDSLPIALG